MNTAHKSPGPDDIRASFLRNTATETTPMLTDLFHAAVVLYWCFTTETCMLMYISPIYKMGSKADRRNYIALLHLLH